MRLGLADAGMGTHGGADEKAVGGVGDEGLIGGGVVGRVDEADPGIELGRADQLGIADVDVVDDEDLPRSLAAHGAARTRRGRGHGRGVSAWRITSGSSALRRTSERVTNVSPWLIVTVLLATERPLCMRSTAMSSGASGDAPRAKTVWIVLTAFPSWPASPAITDCASSWPPKTTPWVGAEAVGPVAVGADLLERQGVDERSNGEHRASIFRALWGGGHSGTTVWRVSIRPPVRSERGREAECRHLTVVFDGDVKVRYPPEERLPRHASRDIPCRCRHRPPS